MSLPIKLQLPDSLIEEMQKWQSIVNNPLRSTVGQATYQNPRTLASYTTVGSAYDNQGEQGLGLLLFNVNPNLKQYIFDVTTYGNVKSDMEANTKGTSDYFVTTGTQPNYVVTTGNAYASLPDGFKITVKPHADSTGAVTLNVDGLGAKNCLTQTGETIVIKSGVPFSLRYNGTNFIEPSSGGLASFFGDGSDGTIPNLNTVTTAPNGGTVANLWDMNVGTTFVTGSLSSVSDQVVFSIDFGKPMLIHPYSGLSVDFYSISISTGANRTLEKQYSNDGTTWISDAGTASISTTPSLVGVGNVVTVPYRYWRFVLKAGGSSCALTCQGLILNKISADSQTTKVFRIIEPSTLNGGAVVKQYTSYTLPVGYEHTVQNPCQGLIIYSQGDVTVNGIIDMSQKAGLAPNANPIPMIISPTYQNIAKTSSLLHFDNNITDDNGRIWTNNGAATFDATNKKFGTHAISFNGTTQYLTTPMTPELSLDGENFTIDFWARLTSVSAGLIIFGVLNASGLDLGYKLATTTGSVLQFSATTADNTFTHFVNGKTAIIANAYTHIAVVRDGEWVKIYVNGVLDAELYVGTTIFRRSASPLTIGRNGDQAGGYITGQIDELRIIKGKAMYTANFAPPTSAYSYQATITDTVDAFKEYFKLTNSLKVLRGGYGGNGGYGGGYSGSSGRQTSVGIGGAGRQNLGGFGGGGSGGGDASGPSLGGIGGSILNAEIGGGSAVTNAYTSGYSSSDGVNGGGATGVCTTSGKVSSGICFGAGSGGLGGTSNIGVTGNSGSYSGGFVGVIAKGNFSNTGSILSNGGSGGNGLGASTTNNRGGGGGGGGAGGGVVALYYKGTYSNTGSITVNGGAGGTGGSGFGTGETGGTATSGSVGTIYTQQL